MQRDALSQGLACSIHLEEGSFIENLKLLLDKESYETVIMGSHGVSGKEEWFIGSNTSKAIRKLHNNFLVVKRPVETLDFSEVVFVTGLRVVEQNSFRLFLDFIEPFNAKEIHIMCVDTSGYFNQPTIVMHEALKDFKEITNSVNVKSHFYSDVSI